MKNLQIIGLAVCIAMMTGGLAQYATQNTKVQQEPQASALDSLMAAVGEQFDTDHGKRN